MADQGGLSDALRHLADHKPAEPSEHPGDLPAAHNPTAGEAGGVPAHDESQGDVTGPPDAASSSHAAPGNDATPTDQPFDDAPVAASGDPASSTSQPNRPPAHDHLKIAAVPVLAVVGLLLLVPGVWAVCMIMGIELLMPRSPDAVMMAWIMLISWPIAITLLVSAVFLFRQLRRGP